MKTRGDWKRSAWKSESPLWDLAGWLLVLVIIVTILKETTRARTRVVL